MATATKPRKEELNQALENINTELKELENQATEPQPAAKPAAKKPLPPIRRERLEPEELAHVVMNESDRVGFRDIKVTIEPREVAVFQRTETRDVINVGDNVMIYGLYHKTKDGEGQFRDVFYDVIPTSNLAQAYCKDLNPNGISVATPRRAARLALLIETYCRLFVQATASTEVALSVKSNLDGGKKPVLIRKPFKGRIGYY